MGNPQPLGNEFVLGSNIIIKRNCRKRPEVRVRGGSGLAVSEEGGDDDAVFLWGERARGAEEPGVVTGEPREPAWIEDGREGAGAVDGVGDLGGGEDGAGLEGEVAEGKGLEGGFGDGGGGESEVGYVEVGYGGVGFGHGDGNVLTRY